MDIRLPEPKSVEEFTREYEEQRDAELLRVLQEDLPSPTGLYVGYFSNVFRGAGSEEVCLIKASDVQTARMLFAKHVGWLHPEEDTLESWMEVWVELSEGEDWWQVYPLPILPNKENLVVTIFDHTT